MSLVISNAVPLTIKAADGKRRFEILAYTGGLLRVDGFDLPVIVDLAGLEASSQIPILIDHEKSVSTTLGITDTVNNDGTRLTLAGYVTGTSDLAMQVIAQATAGHTWQASIGALTSELEDVPAGRNVTVNGQTFAGPVIVARRSVLRETSVLPIGADADTTVNLAAAAALIKGAASMPTFEEWIVSLGLDTSTLSPENIAALQLAYEAVTSGESQTAEAMEDDETMAAAEADDETPAEAGIKKMDIKAVIAEQNKAIAANLQRTAEIQAKAAGYPTIAAKAIEEGWSPEKVELHVLRAQMSRTAPTSHRRTEDSQPAMSVLEAAICMAGKTKDAEKRFKPEVLQAASSRYRNGIGLQEMILEAAIANGWHGRSFRHAPSECLRAAMQRPDSIEAGFTALSLPGIMSNVANKFLLEGYETVEDTWQQVSATAPVSDFKERTSYRLAVDGKFEKVGPGGRLKHGSFSEESFTNKAETFGKMFGITRQDIINDDLGAMTAVPRQIGRGAALELNTVFWTEFLANNDTFYTTDRGNYMEGSTTPLSIVSLTAGELLFLDQVDPNGEPMAIAPSLLLVPNALNVTASQLANDTEVRDNTTNKVYTTSNPHAGKFSVVRSSYLSNSTITGNSTTAWYLMASPSDIPVIEVVFLNGQQTPTVEEADADFSTLGIEMRGYFDFGVAKQDYRGAIKSKGAS